MVAKDTNAVEQSDAECAWSLLESELDAWSSADRIAQFWWRDDDAAAPGPKLDRLIEITEQAGLLLAVIPTRLTAALVGPVSKAPHVFVGQHGYAHVNHAPRGRGLGAWELGLHRGAAAVLADLDAGRDLILEHFESDFLNVVVPPWNHIAPELLEPLSDRGFCAVSAFGPRDRLNPYPGLSLVNAHCDPIRWKSGAHFRGVNKSIVQLTEHLQARRLGKVDSDEPTGLLTHHIDLDAPAWAFCEQLASLIQNHAAAQWCSPQKLFKRYG